LIFSINFKLRSYVQVLQKNTIYVRIKPNLISALHIQSGNEYSDIPAIAIEKKAGKSSIIAVGIEATHLTGFPNITVANGFKHPRTLLADFAIAERTLKYFVFKVFPISFFKPAPTLIIHPLEVLDGGLTQIEIRAFGELGAMTGSKQVYVWEGVELSKNDLLDRKFPPDKGKLLFP
jgi:rod shape-determining protein MreB and related proteins